MGFFALFFLLFILLFTVGSVVFIGIGIIMFFKKVFTDTGEG